jgi:hypothetical protein
MTSSFILTALSVSSMFAAIILAFGAGMHFWSRNYMIARYCFWYCCALGVASIILWVLS